MCHYWRDSSILRRRTISLPAKPLGWDVIGSILYPYFLAQIADRIARLVRIIHSKLSIPAALDPDFAIVIQGREFFVSSTKFTKDQYSARSLANPLLNDVLEIPLKEYEEYGLFLLRATVVNPFYRHAEERGTDLLYEFLLCLHRITRDTMAEMLREESQAGLSQSRDAKVQ